MSAKSCQDLIVTINNFLHIPLAFCTKFCNAKEVKKLLFLSAIIFFQILGIFTLYSSNLISPISAQECRAPGAECGTSGDDKNQCCSIVKAEDVIPGYKAGDPLKCGKEPGSDKNTCIVNKTLGEGDACEGDQANDGGEPIGIGDATVGGQVPGGTDGKEDSTSLCGGDLICNKDTKKCEANRKCIKPGQNESVKCEHDTSSNQKNEADKTCCGGFKCQEGKCVADASKKNTCLTDKDTEGNPPKKEAKGDYTSKDFKSGILEENEVCCAKFQQWDFDGKHGERGSKCYNRETNKYCKKENEKAKGDATTKDVLPPDEKCCAGFRRIDGVCRKEVACIAEGETCKVGSFICCGEQSCIIPEGGKVGKCQEGLPHPPSPPCAEGQFKNGKCGAVPTAFGNLSTDPEGFIKSMFALLLSLSGGIALLLIMKSGYLIMTANGKPEAIQSGRDQLIAAIVGLIFLIFSLVILQVIGVEILKLPSSK